MRQWKELKATIRAHFGYLSEVIQPFTVLLLIPAL